MKLFLASLSPILIAIFYFYIKDRYEKEPKDFLFLGIFLGILTVPFIIYVERKITGFMPILPINLEAIYTAFLVASFTEEIFKFLVLFIFIYKNKNFNEKFDGIIYSVFITLGFASVENILYVFNPTLGGIKTAISRAIFSIPGHVFFGVIMGYYFSDFKFEKNYFLKIKHFLQIFFIPFFVHGMYDFLLLSNFKISMILFFILMLVLFFDSLKKMKLHLEASPFKKNKNKIYLKKNN